MKLADLPSMLVERTEPGPGGLQVHGRFDRLEGVGQSGKLRLCRGEYVWVDLAIVDRSTRTVLVTDARDPDVAKLRVGERYTWFHDYWQAPFVEAIADESNEWRRFRFQATDAQYFKQGNAIGWQELGGRLPDGAVPLNVKPGGWDHEHYELCSKHIDAMNPIGYTDAEGHFLCSTCYERYGASHDVSFQLGA
jgi:hypothetical protein